MSLKIRRLRFTKPTSTGAANHTISGFGTVDAVIAIVNYSRSGTADPAANVMHSIGFWDGTNQNSVSISSNDNGSSRSTARALSTSHIISRAKYGSPDTREEIGRITGTVTDGVEITWDTTTAWFIELIFIGGTSNASAGVAQLTNGSVNTDVTIGHEPHVLFAVNTMASNAPEYVIGGGAFSFGVGHYDGTTTNQAMTAFNAEDGTANAQNGQILRDNAILGQVTAAAESYYGTFSRLSSTQFRIATNTSSHGDDRFAYLALALSDADEFHLDVAATPAATGSQSYTGCGFEPDFVHVVATRCDAVNTLYTNTNAMGFSQGSADSTGESSTGFRDRDGADPSQANSYYDATKLFTQLGYNVDTYHAIGDFTSFDSDGWTINFTTLNANAQSREFIWFASGPISAGPTYTLTVNHDSLTASGQSSDLTASRLLTVANESLTATGQSVTLTYTPASGPDYTLTVNPATVNVTGQDVDLIKSWLLTVDPDVINAVGQSVTLTNLGAVTIQDVYTKVLEIWKLLGLDSANPLTVTPTARVAGDIEQDITGDGVTSTTVTRKES